MKYFFLFLISVSITCFSQGNTDLKLWYTTPSGSTWENALPVGNGRVGAMVYGNVVQEMIQLNEHTLWSGSPHRNDNSAARDALPELRQLIWEGKQHEAQQLANQVIISHGSQGQKFQPVGNFHLTFKGHDHYSNYYREVDIERAVAKTSYTVEEVTYTRQVFASLADPVIVLRLTANKKQRISFTAAFTTPHKKSSTTIFPQGKLIMTGVASNHEGVEGKIRFNALARVLAEGGDIQMTDSTVVVQNANAVTICIAMATNFKTYKDLSGNEVERAEKDLENAVVKSFTQMEKEHVAAYQNYFNRVKLNLGTTKTASLPTDIRLKNFRDANDPQFAALYFQYGRYLLISSSQPGGQPANLQGIWNDKMNPPWDSKYTININAEMNYWPAERTNLSELHEPFLKLVEELAETGKETAQVMYGARGWTAHHNTDIWRTTGAVDGAFWGAWNAGGGWTSQHLWEHYLYTGDSAYLAKIYPVLKGAALFYCDFLVAHPRYQWLVVNPDMSPENAPTAHQGSSLDAGTTMSNQIVFDVLSTAICASEKLNTDADFIDTLKNIRSRLAPMHVGQHNQLQEWLDDIDDPNDHHRHVSHLYGLFPSSQISPYRTPQLYHAAKTTLLHRGDVSTGWSMGWKVNWWARLLDGNHSYQLIQNQLTPVGVNADGGGTYNNLFDAHPPFQIDGNFGCTSGIAEMLMQSGQDAIHLLPALPDAWATGSVSGLRAKGGFEIMDMQWKNGKLIKVVIQSHLGGNLRLRVPNSLKSKDGTLTKAEGKNSNWFYQVQETPAPVISSAARAIPPYVDTTRLVDLPTQKGKTYSFVAQKE